jgi:hypothetical protein
MAQLTAFLQQGFARPCPAGWRYLPERSLLAPPLAELLGYHVAPRGKQPVETCRAV